jgi:histidine ammonia-lyase
LEVLKGTVKAFHPLIHKSRPHTGQQLAASRIRSVLHDPPNNPSEIYTSHKNCSAVQDSYTLRCAPQVHGIVHDTINFVMEILTTECNSATDNPMIFANEEDDDCKQGLIISGGNFHGEYPAKALDYLCIAIHEISNISERRIERLVNPTLSSLPAFLVQMGGLNSGFMIAHCTAAALVSENKGLCHPASIDSVKLKSLC